MQAVLPVATTYCYFVVYSCSMVDLAGAEEVDLDSHRKEETVFHILYYTTSIIINLWCLYDMRVCVMHQPSLL